MTKLGRKYRPGDPKLIPPLFLMAFLFSYTPKCTSMKGLRVSIRWYLGFLSRAVGGWWLLTSIHSFETRHIPYPITNPSTWGFSKSQGPKQNQHSIGFLLQQHPHKGSPTYGHSHMDLRSPCVVLKDEL